MDDSSVSTMLRDVAETPSPPSRVDVSRATAVGRRRVRARRLVGGGSVAAGVMAVVAVVGLLTTGALAPRVSMPSVAPTQFDPLVQYAEFGWLPEGSIGSGVSVGQDRVQLWVDYPVEGPSSTQVRLTLAAAGVDEFRGLSANPATDEPTQVNGRDAWWAHNGTAVNLRWEYAPGAWAVVEVWRALGLDRREVARRVAENVRYGVNKAIRLPFTTTGIPSELSLTEAMVYQHDFGWHSHVKYDDSLGGGVAALTVDVWFSVGATDGGNAVNTTVDGHPAFASASPGGGAELYVFDVDGLVVRIGVSHARAMALLPGGLEGLFRATEFYADPADWR